MKASLFVALAAALFLCATPRTHAQAAPADSVTLAKIPVRAVKLTAPVKVDGGLDEPVWSNDQPVTRTSCPSSSLLRLPVRCTRGRARASWVLGIDTNDKF